MPERFEIYIVYKRRCINTVFPFLSNWLNSSSPGQLWLNYSLLCHNTTVDFLLNHVVLLGWMACVINVIYVSR